MDKDRKCYKCGLIFLDKHKTYWHYKNHPTHRPPESDTNNMNNSNLGKRKTSTEEETIIEEMLTDGIRWLDENQSVSFLCNRWMKQYSVEKLLGLRATYIYGYSAKKRLLSIPRKLKKLRSIQQQQISPLVIKPSCSHIFYQKIRVIG